MAGNRSISARGRFQVDEGQLRVLLSGPGGETSQDIQRRARAVQRRAQTAAPKRTGELRSSIHVNTRYPSEGAVAEISAEAGHAAVVEFGRRAVSVEGSGRVLHWNGPPEVYSMKAGPVAATHFMRDSLDAVDD